MITEKAYARFAIVGNQSEAAINQEISAVVPNAISLAGKTTLRETFSIVASSDLVICNSSLLMHVTAAFSKPALVLLGESITSTKQHAAQWACSADCHMLGKDERHPQICSPREALDQVLAILA